MDPASGDAATARPGTSRVVVERTRTLRAERFPAADGASPPAPEAEPAPPIGGEPEFEGTSATDRLRRGVAADARRFRIDGLLGMGATGQVWSVHDRNLDRLVAVKVLNQDGGADPEQLDSFLREARIAASLAHPNVLPVYELDLDRRGRPWFSMGRIAGRTLGSAIAESTRAERHAAIGTWNRVVSTAIDLCQAAAYAHHRGIVHQDIKPDNVLLGDFGEVLLLDWGSAGRVDASGKVASGLYGTPLYMSPEQARREGADARSDVYCIGATLFHALALRPPTWSDDDRGFWAMKRAGAIQPPEAGEREGVPPELYGIALKALEADPARRYATAEAMRADLEAYQAGLAVSAHRYGLWRRLRGWYRRHAAMVWVCVVAAIAVAAAAGVAIAERRKEAAAWQLVASEDFSSPDALARGWRLRQRGGWTPPFVDLPLPAPTARVVEGRLVLDPGDGLTQVSWDQPARGDLAVEWMYVPLETPDNLNCFIGGPDRESAFTFHLGGYGLPDRCTLTYGPKLEYLCDRPLPTSFRLGEPCRMRMERAARHVRLWVDGELVVDWHDAEDLGGGLGQRFGFDAIRYHRMAVDDVRIWRRAVAQRVSPIEIGDKLYQLGQWDEAYAQYREIRDSYPGGDLALRAEFRMALCDRALGRTQEALRTFAVIAERAPDHELAVVALRQRADLARDVGDTAEREAARRAMAERHRGHPLLVGEARRVVDAAESRVLAAIQAGGPDGRQAVFDSVMAMQREILDVQERFGIDLEGYKVQRSNELLLNNGQQERVHELPLRDPQTFVRACIFLGRMDEALAASAGLTTSRFEVLLAMGRPQEALSSAERMDERMWALQDLGDIAAMRRLAPEHQLVEAWDLHEGGFDAYLARYRDHDRSGFDFGVTQRLQVLIERGEGERILREYAQHYSAYSRGYLALGRLPETLDAASREEERGLAVDTDVVARVVIRALERGDQAVADRALAMLAARGESMDWKQFLRRIVRAMAAAQAGDTARAREILGPGAADQARPRDGARAWHVASYALGAIDDARFRAQPHGRQVEARLLVARALRHELAGEAREAAERWRELLAKPFWQRDLPEVLFDLARWRVRAAGLGVPADARLPTTDPSWR